MTTLLKPMLYSFVVFLVAGMSVVSGLTVTTDTVQVPDVNDTTTLSCILNEAPNGLSGSNFPVSLADPGCPAPVNGSVTASVPPVAEFSVDPQFGTAPLAARFTDASNGEIEEWFWDFGDSTNATDQNPLHSYASPGLYTVSLTVTNGAGSSTEESVACICVSPPCEPEDTCSKTWWLENPQELEPLLPVWLGTQNGSDSIQVTDHVQAVAIMAQKSRWNGIPLLQGELLAAKLNIKAGCDPAPVEDTIALADAFLADHNDFDWFRMSPRQWAAVNAWIDALEAYNNS